MIDAKTIEELRGLAEKATSGRWKVFAQEREYVGGTKRSVFEIKTEGKHPQSKDHYPVVAECQHNLPDGPQRGIWMDEADAAFIVAMRNALPALLDVASSTLTADAGDGELIARERDNARAECSWLANSLLKYLSDLQNIARDIEDEGDRYYFGSTNDADLLKEIVEKIENYGFNRITRASKWPDYIRQSAKAHARAESAEARATASESLVAELREKVERLMKALEDIYRVGDGYNEHRPEDGKYAGTTGEGHARCRDIAHRACTALEGRKDG